MKSATMLRSILKSNLKAFNFRSDRKSRLANSTQFDTYGIPVMYPGRIDKEAFIIYGSTWVRVWPEGGDD